MSALTFSDARSILAGIGARLEAYSSSVSVLDCGFDTKVAELKDYNASLVARSIVRTPEPVFQLQPAIFERQPSSNSETYSDKSISSCESGSLDGSNESSLDSRFSWFQEAPAASPSESSSFSNKSLTFSIDSHTLVPCAPSFREFSVQRCADESIPSQNLMPQQADCANQLNGMDKLTSLMLVQTTLSVSPSAAVAVETESTASFHVDAATQSPVPDSNPITVDSPSLHPQLFDPTHVPVENTDESLPTEQLHQLDNSSETSDGAALPVLYEHHSQTAATSPAVGAQYAMTTSAVYTHLSSVPMSAEVRSDAALSRAGLGQRLHTDNATQGRTPVHARTGATDAYITLTAALDSGKKAIRVVSRSIRRCPASPNIPQQWAFSPVAAELMSAAPHTSRNNIASVIAKK